MTPERPPVVVIRRQGPLAGKSLHGPGVFVHFEATGDNSNQYHSVDVFIPAAELMEPSADDDPIARLHEMFLDAVDGALRDALGKSKMEASPR